MGTHKRMSGTLLRALPDGCISKAVAVLTVALAVLHILVLPAPAVALTGVLGSQANNQAPSVTGSVPHARASSSNADAGQSSPTRESRLQQLVKSKIAVVVDANSSEELLAKNADRVVPIASITKLMTAMVVLDAKPPLEEKLKISNDDRDFLMGTTSRLSVGAVLSREDMLHLALMSSENRAAAALSRYYPGGRPAFIQAMNAKAKALGMTKTHFVNANGLTNENVSTARDVVKLVQAAAQYQLIREFTTDRSYDVRVGRYSLAYFNSNRLVGQRGWDIDIQKTGFTNEAGRCVVMRVNADGRLLVMVFLDGYGKLTRYADARRVMMQLAASQRN